VGLVFIANGALQDLCMYVCVYFSLAPYARLNWQFSVSFQAHVKSSYSRIVWSL